MAVEKSIFLNNDDIALFINKRYDIKPICIEALSGGSANCYKILCKNGAFFLKEFQDKFNKNTLENEIFVRQELVKNGIPTSNFIKSINDDYIVEKNGRFFHLQGYIDGVTLGRNCFEPPLLFESAKMLGKINQCLSNIDALPDGFPDSWFDEWDKRKSIKKHTDILKNIESSELRDDLKQKVISACHKKIDLLEKYNFDYLVYKQLKKVNSHGDYNNLQIICEKDLSKIKAVIDFSSTSYIPAVWEIIRSYTYSAKECVDGNDIDLHSLKAYLDQYLKYYDLPLFDISNMTGFYYYHLLRSSFGLNSTDEKTIEFALWRTNLCDYLSKTHQEIDEFLIQRA